jgi:hypothetical protein
MSEGAGIIESIAKTFARNYADEEASFVVVLRPAEADYGR